MDSNEPLCLISNTNNNKELIFETHADQNQKPKKDEIKDEIFFDHDSKQSLPIDSEDEKSDNESCDRDVDPTSHRSKSPISPKKRGETGVDRVCGDELVSVETESLDVESLGAKHEILPFDSEINSEKAAMFKVYQPWVIKTYGDFTKTKTVSLKKYDRIVRTLLGLIPNCAENSKFRFWIRSKGFRLGLPSSIAPVSDPNQLYVLGRKSGTEGRSYRKVAVVEQFFEIIYQVHVESGGKHAGQKKTYRTITQTYAFLPREAVTKFLLGCAECQKRLDLDSLGSDIFKNNKDTPVKRAQKRKHNTWDPSPSSFSIDPSCYSTNLSIPLDNRKRKYLKLPKYPSELCLADDEGNNSDGYVPTDKYEDSREFYPTCKESSTRNPTKAIEYNRDDKLFQVATKTESDGEEESKAKPSLKLCIKEETDEKTDLVLDFRYKSLKSLARQKFKDQDKDTEDSEKDEASDVERKYGCESNKLHPKLDSRDPLYKIKSEFYLRHQIDHQNVRKERDYFVNVPNLLPPVPVLSLRLGHEDGYPSETKITDPVRACNSKKYLLPHANGSSRRKRFSSKRYTSTPEPMSHLYSRNSSQSLRYGPRNSSSSTNENESCENSYGAEILDLSPINSQNRISKFKLPQSRAPVSYIQIPVWNPDLLRYHSKGRTMESGRTARVPDADPSECPDRLSAHPTDEDSDSDHPTSTCERRTKHVGYFDQEPTSSQANMMTTEMETTDDDHFSSRNGELRLSEDLPGEEMAGGGLWPSYPLGLKKSTSTPPGSRDLSSPVILQETGSVHDETSSSGNKEDEDEDEEDVDDLKTLPHDPERLKAFNMFVRLFVDENLDRIVPISKQPKEKIQAIIDSCTRQFPEFAERARKRIRTYLKSCRRNKRARDPGNWPEANRPTPAHLTSVQAEQILAQACENESHNAKRMRLGLEPVSQPMPVLPGQTEQPRPIDHFSSSSLTTTTTSSLNNNTPSSGSNTSISQTDTASTETKEPPGAGGSGKTVLQQHLINNNNNIANNNNIKDVLNFTKGLTATSINSDHSSSKTTNSRSSLSSSSALNGSPVVSRMEASPLYRPNPAFSQAFSPRGVSSQTSIYAGASPNMFSASPFGPAGMMGNGPTDLSMKQASKPLLNHKLSPAEMAAVRQLITGYRESAAFLLRSADELETLLLQQP